MLSHLFGQPRRAMLTVMAYILLLMCGIGWTIFSFIQEREEVMVHNISLFLKRGVLDQAHEVASHFQYRLLGMHMIAQDIAQADGHDLGRESLRFCEGRIMADNFFVADVHGRVWGHGALPLNLLAHPYFDHVLNGRAIVSHLLEDANGESYVVLAAPILQENQIIGCVGAIYRRVHFTAFFQLTSFLSNEGVILLNEDGKFIGAPPGGPDVTSYFLELYRQYMPTDHPAHLEENAWVAPVTDRAGRKVYLCVGNLPFNGWRVATAISGKDLPLDFSGGAQAMRNLFVRLGIFFILSMVFTVISMRGIFARRMDDLAREASTDRLTGLLNRTAFESRVDAELAASGKGLLAVFDLDNFKHVNDEHGHPAGDSVIAQVGNILRACLPSDALCARLGGDEFLVFLPGHASSDDGLPHIEQLMDAIRSDALLRSYGVTASMGICAAPPDGGVFRKLYSSADIALYASKRCGRDRISSYSQVQATPLPPLLS